MHFALSALAVLSTLILPAAAYANTSDAFTVTGHGLDLTFTLPSSPTPSGFDMRRDFFLGNISFTEDGTMMTASDVYFFTKLESGGFELDDSLGNVIDDLSFFGPKLFTGTVKAPTFKEGAFRLTGGPACSVDSETTEAPACSYKLTIDPTSVTPEPSSLALLGSGALGVFGILRRRLLA